MSLNWLGLGFNFGAKDHGLSKAVKRYVGGLTKFKNVFDDMRSKTAEASPQIGKGFQLIESALQGIDKILAQNKLQTWIASVSLARLNDISGGIKDIAGGINLTTSLEGTIVSNTKATKAMAVNFGYAGKEARDFTSYAASLAYSLNIGTDTAGNATYAYKEYGDVLRAVGVDSSKTAAKVAEVFGIDIRDFGSRLDDLRGEFGFTDSELSNLVGSMTAFGKQSGNVKDALNQLPSVVDMIRKRALAMGRQLDSKTLADYAAQTQELASGFYSVTKNGSKAQEQALALTNALIASDVNIGKMFAGTDTDLSTFSQSLGIATGDIDKAFSLMRQGPAGFVKGLADMVVKAGGYSKMTAEQANFLHQQLVEALGDETASMVTSFFQNADEETLKSMASTRAATAELGKLAKAGFSTGLTLQDSFERMQQGFVMTFRNIARAEAHAFVKDTGDQFKVFNARMKEVAAEGGPLGAIISKFSEMHQLGAMALLPDTLRPIASVFGTMMTEATPLVGALGSLGLRFSHLTNPLTLAAVGFGALAWSMKAAERQALKTDKALQKERTVLQQMEQQQGRLLKQGKATKEIDAQILNQRSHIADMEKRVVAEAKVKNQQQISAVAKAAIEKIGSFLAAVPSVFRGVWATVKEMWPEIGPPIVAALSRALEWAKTTAWPVVKNFFRGLWLGVLGATDPSTEKAVGAGLGASLGRMLREGLLFAYGAVRKYLTEWWGRMTAIWSDDSLSFTDKIKQSMQGSAGVIIGAFALAKFTPVFGILSSLTGILGGTLFKAVGMLGSLLSWVGGTAFTLFTQGFGAAFPILGGLVDVLATVLGVGAGLAGFIAVVAGLSAAFYFFPEATKKAVDAIGDFVEKAFSWLTQKALDIGFHIVKYLVLGPLGMLALAGPKIIGAVVSAIKAIIQVAVKAIVGILDGIEKWLVDKFPAAAKTIHAVFNVLKNVVYFLGFLAQKTAELMGWALNKIGGLLTWVGDLIMDTFSVIWKTISFVVGLIVGFFELLYDGVSFVYENGILPFIKGFQMLGGVVKKVFEWIGETVIGPILEQFGWLQDAAGDIGDALGSIIGSVGGFFSDIGSSIGGFFSDIGGGIADFFSSEEAVIAETAGRVNSAYQDAQRTAEALPGAAAPQFAKFQQAGMQAADAVRKAYESAVPKKIEADEKLEKQIQKFREIQAEFDKKSGADLEEGDFLDKFHKQSAEVEKLTGHTGQFYLQLEKLQQASFTASDLGFQNANKSFIAGYQTRLDTIFDVVTTEAKHLDDLRAAGDITQQQFEDRLKQVTERALIQRTELETAMKMTSDDFTRMVGQASTTAGQLTSIAVVTTDRYIADLRTKIAALPGEMQSFQAAALQALQQSYQSELQVVFNKPIEERAAAMADLKARYDLMTSDLLAKSLQFSADWSTNVAGTTATAKKYFDDLTQSLTDKSQQMNEATTAAVGSMQRELGIGNEEALKSLEAVATIDPKKFDDNLKKLKKSFIDFTKEIGESFRKAWEVALKATADAMLAIDTDLTTALGHLKGIGAAMDTKASLQATTRNKERVDDIRLMSENERDQQLLNATNWPLWYEDHRAQTAQLIALVGAGAGARGGRVSASQDAIDRGKAPNGTRRGGRS